MNNEGLYETDSLQDPNSEDQLLYAFVSKGQKEINKLIAYQRISYQIEVPSIGPMTVYNLGFGDQKKGTYEIDDAARSNNGDMIQVFNTVLFTIPEFFENHPKNCLYVRGFDQQRTNIYCGYLSRHFATFSTDYAFFGQLEDSKFEPYICRKEYVGILFFQK